MEDDDNSTAVKSPERRLRKLHRLLAAVEAMPDALLAVAAIVALHVRYSYYQHRSLLYIGVVGAVVAVLHSVLLLLLGGNGLWGAPVLFHLWLGALLGLVALLDISTDMQHSLADWEQCANLLLVASVVCAFAVHVLLRCCCNQRPLSSDRLWERREQAELVGASIACLLAASPADQWALQLLLLALTAVLTAMRLGSFPSVLLLALLVFNCESYLFPDLHLSINPFGMIVLVVRLALTPLFDQCLGGSMARLERWQTFIQQRPLCHRLCVMLVLIVEVVFFVAHATVVSRHQEWFVVVPLFALVSVIWLVLHIVFLVVLLTLVNRFASSHQSTQANLSMKKALAARGLRYFALVARRLMYVCMGSTCALSVLCWTTRTPYNMSLLAIVLSLEAMVTELLSEFSRSLGGTCIGFGFIAPVVSVRNDGLVTVLPPNFIQEAGARSTRTLRAVVDFFADHMITNHGCDWNMAGIALSEVEKKLTDFFQQTTAEGPRYDTYFLYYSGPTTVTGDWALTNGATLSLDGLLSLWFEQNPDMRRSRLILMCDCENSWQWMAPISRLRATETFVALQTLQPLKAGRRDPEATTMAIGDFTETWAELQTMLSGSSSSGMMQQDGWRPAYAVSRCWTDFDFRKPDAQEILAYWLATLPRITHGCLHLLLLLLAARTPLCGSCDRCCLRALRRARQRLWPAAELDTGHGFRLLLG